MQQRAPARGAKRVRLVHASTRGKHGLSAVSLRRVPFFEAAILDSRQAAKSEYSAKNQRRWRHSGEVPEEFERSLHIGNALTFDGSYGDSLGKLARHEASLMSALTKTLQTLLLLRRDRANDKGDKTKLKVIALPPAACEE